VTLYCLSESCRKYEVGCRSMVYLGLDDYDYDELSVFLISDLIFTFNINASMKYAISSCNLQ
jgi:hypothetical protein